MIRPQDSEASDLISAGRQKQESHSEGIRKVRIASVVDKPFANPCFPSYPNDLRCVKPGIEIEYIYTVLAGLLHYEIEWVRVNSYAELEGSIQNGTADMMGISYNLRQKYLDKGLVGSPIFLTGGLMLITKELHVSEHFLGVFKVFDFSVWLLVFGTMNTLRLLNFLSKRINRGMLLGREGAEEKNLPWLRDKIFQTLWLILLGVVLKCCTSLMSIDLAIPLRQSTTPFQTFEGSHTALEDGTCHWILPRVYEKDNEFFDNLINPTSDRKEPWAQRFREIFMQSNKVLYVENREAVAENILTSDNCLVGIDYLTLDSFYSSRYCNLRFFTSLPLYQSDTALEKPDRYDLPQFRFVYYYSRSLASMTEDFEVVLASHSLNNFYPFLTRKYYSAGLNPNCSQQTRQSSHSVKLLSLKTVFWFLLCGLGQASVFVIMEIAIHSYTLHSLK